MDNMNKIISTIKKAQEVEKSTYAYDTEAEVTRIEGNTAWVHIPSGVDETPVKMTIDASVGDNVQVRVGGGRAWLTGNASAPPTDDKLAILSKQVAEIAEITAKVADEKAETADDKATDAKETAEAILIYDTTYEMSGTTANFEAFVYQGGVDIKTKFETDDFSWYLKTESGTTFLGHGYTISVNTTTCGYGAEVIGSFQLNDDAELLTDDNANLTNNSGQHYTARASGDEVKVRELTTVTTLYPQEKLMVIGTQDEHLITVQTLQDYLNLNLEKQVLFDTTANWNAQSTLQTQANTLYVYTDYDTDENNNLVAGIKVGDGNAYLIDKPFLDVKFKEHALDSTLHTTEQEKTFWNNKVRCYYTGIETLVFTTL